MKKAGVEVDSVKHGPMKTLERCKAKCEEYAREMKEEPENKRWINLRASAVEVFRNPKDIKIAHGANANGREQKGGLPERTLTLP